ncbi:MAG: Gluconeogenesis factor, partial [Chlamydiae bacterium]|nr:Gluconeogenesis factor [Chlamydiota bacterium]
MKKVVVIGGGTGNFVVLKGLKKYDVSLSAVVSMADDGGSTGILRDELGVLPPGDVRQCLVALSDSSLLMRSLMNYRFENGGLGGHSFGNLLLSALEKVTGSFEQAIEEVGRILFIKGKVIPVTTHLTRLKMLLKNNTLLDGEKEVFVSQELEQGYRDIYLEPYPK